MKPKCPSCKSTRVKPLLPDLYLCKSCDAVFSGERDMGIYFSPDDNPILSVITTAQAGVIALDTKNPGSFINLEEVQLTRFNFTRKISELPSLTHSQKLNVIDRFKDYGFET